MKKHSTLLITILLILSLAVILTACGSGGGGGGNKDDGASTCTDGPLSGSWSWEASVISCQVNDNCLDDTGTASVRHCASDGNKIVAKLCSNNVGECGTFSGSVSGNVITMKASDVAVQCDGDTTTITAGVLSNSELDGTWFADCDNSSDYVEYSFRAVK